MKSRSGIQTEKNLGYRVVDDCIIEESISERNLGFIMRDLIEGCTAWNI